MTDFLFLNDDDEFIDFVNLIWDYSNPENSLILTPGIGKVLENITIGELRTVICGNNLLKKIYLQINDYNDYIVGDISRIEFQKQFGFIYLNLLNFDGSFHKHIQIMDRSLKFLTKDGIIFIVLSSSHLSNNRMEQLREEIINRFQLLMVVELPSGFISEFKSSFKASILVIKNAAPISTIFLHKKSNFVDFNEIYESFKNKNVESIVPLEDFDKKK